MYREDFSRPPIAVLHEHPEWFQPLFAELERRGIPYERWLAHEHGYDPRVRSLPYSLVINRMSPSAYLRDHGSGIFYALHLLAYLQDIRVPVLNPLEAFRVETSKCLQIEIFERLGVPYPRTRIVNHPAGSLAAAEGLRYPIVVKPNIGGSGAKITKFERRKDLEEAVRSGTLDLGFDGTALVQEFLPARENSIVRVEILDGRFLYAIRIRNEPNGSFNLCPADICQDESADSPGEEPEEGLGSCPAAVGSGKRRLEIEAVEPPGKALDAALRIARAAHLDVGGIEYLVDDRDGGVCFYDVNALSNFVTDAERIVGFNPHARFVDFVLERACQEA